ncbi:MAG: LLM class flavin-dependent oxidoreductase [Myxococcales bacterium]|nr:MAG: LLM class flavin-dependent oxidoreductase [Myxococcales bacterium]
MKYGYIATNFGYCGDARTLVELAKLAEDSGWDCFFTSDHIHYPGHEPAADPWVALAAVAVSTERILLGPMVTPLPRRHLAKLAREATTLDHLCGGRLILGVGSGGPALPEYTDFGDFGDAKTRAAMLDEGLGVLRALWSGEAVDHHGQHYTVVTEGFARPVQRPGIPIWVAATWPHKKPLRRAARWDGVYPMHRDTMKGHMFTRDELSELVAYVSEHRTNDGPYDVCTFGMTSGPDDTSTVGAYAEVGATWWHDFSVPWLTSLDEVRARLRKGPPRV